MTLRYEPASNQLDGTGGITATATQDLSRSTSICVASRSRAYWSTARPRPSRVRGEQELVITPSAGLPSGRQFAVTIDYAGTPPIVIDPDDAIEGWVPTHDGAFVVGKPQVGNIPSYVAVDPNL